MREARRARGTPPGTGPITVELYAETRSDETPYLRRSPERSPDVTTHAFLDATFVAAALVGLWLAQRLPQGVPKTAGGAFLCLGAAFLVPGLGTPLLGVALAALPVGLAVLVSVFPVFVCTFALVALGLRYFAALGGHGVR